MTKMWRTVILGVTAGLVMGLALFFTGAVAARIAYGPQMTPDGKFTPDQINAAYFVWTKLLIGCFFGVLFAIVYERLPLNTRVASAAAGAKYAAVLWLLVYLWGLSHPLVYELRWTLDRDQLFWMVYTFGGFLGFGLAYGALRRRVLGRAG